MVQADIGLRLSILPPIILVILVDNWSVIVMVMTEVDICLMPDNFIHITMVYYTLPTQVFLKNLFQGVWKDNIHIKIILIIIVQAFHHTLIQSFHNNQSQHFTSSLSKHSTTPNFCVSIFHFYYNACTLCSCTLPPHTILSLSTYTTQ